MTNVHQQTGKWVYLALRHWAKQQTYIKVHVCSMWFVRLLCDSPMSLWRFCIWCMFTTGNYMVTVTQTHCGHRPYGWSWLLRLFLMRVSQQCSTCQVKWTYWVVSLTRECQQKAGLCWLCGNFNVFEIVYYCAFFNRKFIMCMSRSIDINAAIIYIHSLTITVIRAWTFVQNLWLNKCF